MLAFSQSELSIRSDDTNVRKSQRSKKSMFLSLQTVPFITNQPDRLLTIYSKETYL